MAKWSTAPDDHADRERDRCPSRGPRTRAQPMMATLYITGAIAATPKRPWVLRIAEATAPSARKIGDRSMIRVSCDRHSSVAWAS